jgi:UDP-N-acetylglucosamine pyrophosphorylase
VLIKTNVHNRQFSDLVPEKIFHKHSMNQATVEQYSRRGIELVAQNKVCIILVASEYAFFGKDVVTMCLKPITKLPSKKTPLQMMLERIKYFCLQCTGAVNGLASVPKNATVATPVYIMTSEKENDVVYSYLEKLGFLGFSNLFVFPQRDLPAFSNQGLICLKDVHAVHLFPNGSGGLFNCIQSYDLLNHM